MEVFETPTINTRVWAALSKEQVNSWSLVDHAQQSCVVVIQHRVLATFAYNQTGEDKPEAWQQARSFARDNNLVRLAVPDAESTFLASRDIFMYSKLYGGSGVAYGEPAQLASQKVHAKDIEWLEKLVQAIGVHRGSYVLNKHEGFLAACKADLQN
ncbi:hypothetical protein V8Z74_14710 [Comamonas sp. w2-DMI]|uniref:hypothetical protein n=1 Tax=Comamonas sp. w2-DMI TaxID=3126391 RepID=UPI0032E45694